MRCVILLPALERAVRTGVQYQLSRFVAWPFLQSMGRPKVVGLENIPGEGAAILASNHLSIIDSVYLPFVLPRPVVFPAKAEYFQARGPVGRIWAAYLRSTNQLEINRDGARSAQETLDAAVEILRAGKLFGFYPEGTRSPDGKLYRGRSGLGYLAVNSGAPVIPVAMLGTRKMMPPGRNFLIPAKIEVRIGRPLTFPDLAGVAPAKARREIGDRVMAAIRELSGQEYVHMYASDRKAELAAITKKPKELGARHRQSHSDFRRGQPGLRGNAAAHPSRHTVTGGPASHANPSSLDPPSPP
jgi:1-acyl-sn-glycerol-3-phosphate acyltransferase